MKINKERHKKNSRLGIFWGRIYFTSDNRARKSRILWGATEEYLQNECGKQDIKEEDVEHFVNKIVNSWKELKNGIFFPIVRYDAYSEKPQEKADLALFLRENDKV